MMIYINDCIILTPVWKIVTFTECDMVVSVSALILSKSSQSEKNLLLFLLQNVDCLGNP